MGSLHTAKDIVKHLEKLRILTLVHSKINHVIEQFLSRSTLDSNERTYLYSLHFDNIPLDFILAGQQLYKIIGAMGKTDEERIALFSELLVKSQIDPKFRYDTNPPEDRYTDPAIVNEVSERGEDFIRESIEWFKAIMEPNRVIYTAKERLLNANYKHFDVYFNRKQAQ